jgi:small subunit ribosomal protein S16
MSNVLREESALSVKIRLARTGRKKVCRYRIVAADSRMSRDGRFLENLGTYNPQATPKEFMVKTDRVAYWIKKGAQPTETVANLLKQDKYAQRAEAIEKGVPVEAIERLPERKRKAKPKPTPKSS